MRITVRPKPFTGLGTDNRTHFLLAGATANVRLWFERDPARTFPAVRTAPASFVVDLGPDVVPNRVDRNGVLIFENGMPSKQLVTRIDVDYGVDVTLGGLSFSALRIRQRLIPTPRDAHARMRVDYVLAPAGWEDSLGRQRVANSATHPLVEPTLLASGEVIVNTLMLDITPGWRQLHRENRLYKEWDTLSAGHSLNFKVFAHTAGDPFIWYAIIPAHLRGSLPVSPHVFLQPSDNREGQSPGNQQRYLTRNDEYFKADGYTLFKYLLPPVPDQDVARLGAAIQDPRRLRNVVTFGKASFNGKETKAISLNHWEIGAGLQKAFEHIGGGAPAQFLLVPQRVGEPNDRRSGSYGGAINRHLDAITGALFGLIESNTDLTAAGGDVLLRRDKVVLSGYSESGYDLWNVSAVMPDAIKAIIGIEPQNVNSVQNDYRKKDPGTGTSAGAPPKTGKEVIPQLLKRGARVVIIGRHHRQYGPKIAERDKLILLPRQVAEVFRYPPDPSVNDFIKYRVFRVMSPSDDPFFLPQEAAILADLRSRGITGAAAFAAIFTDKANRDEFNDDGVDRWYSHQFALSGGDEMKLDPSGLYGKPVEYRTFFQAAVHMIG